MIKIVCISDSHLGFDLPIKPSALPHRGEDFFANFSTALAYAKEIGADAVIHAGDLFYRSKVPAFIVDRVYGLLQDFADSSIPLYIVPGNHERSQLPASILLFHPGIHIFSEATTFYLPTAQGKVAISGFPFLRHDARKFCPLLMHSLASSVQDADLHLLVVHQIFQHARVTDYTFRKAPNIIPIVGIPTSLDAVICGHIHRGQVLQISTQPGLLPIIHPGSMERTSFQEKDEPKGFVVLQWEKGKPLSWQNIPLPARPMIQLHIPSDLSKEDVMAYLKKEARTIHPHAIVKLYSPHPQWTLPSMATLRSLFPATCILQLPRPHHGKKA